MRSIMELTMEKLAHLSKVLPLHPMILLLQVMPTMHQPLNKHKTLPLTKLLCNNQVLKVVILMWLLAKVKTRTLIIPLLQWGEMPKMLIKVMTSVKTETQMIRMIKRFSLGPIGISKSVVKKE